MHKIKSILLIMFSNDNKLISMLSSSMESIVSLTNRRNKQIVGLIKSSSSVSSDRLTRVILLTQDVYRDRALLKDINKTTHKINEASFVIRMITLLRSRIMLANRDNSHTEMLNVIMNSDLPDTEKSVALSKVADKLNIN